MYKAAERASKTAVVIASSIILSPLYGKLEPVKGKSVFTSWYVPGTKRRKTSQNVFALGTIRARFFVTTPLLRRGEEANSRSC